MFSREMCYSNEFQSIILLFDGFNRPYLLQNIAWWCVRKTLWHYKKSELQNGFPSHYPNNSQNPNVMISSLFKPI